MFRDERLSEVSRYGRGRNQGISGLVLVEFTGREQPCGDISQT
jgi:hypothetical protein